LWLTGTLAVAALLVVFLSRGGLESFAAQRAPVWYDYEIVNVYPHDPAAFTQGLLYRDGRLYESTGLRGRSSLREVRLETGEVLRQRALEPRFFGEGLADWGDRLVQLTWQAGLGFVYDLETFEILRTFRYPGEGWGLARHGEHLIMSDGTAELRFLDPETFEERHRITVMEEGREVRNLNELEVIDGKVYANVFLTDEIVIIDPASGRVTGRIDLRGLLTPAERSRTDVLNGIAYDAEGDRLFVTGKLWPKLFEIELRRRR
jgi:glutaminyl-peptide cyclotransferase